MTTVYLVEKLVIDPMENDFWQAVTYVPYGYVTSREHGDRIIATETVVGTGWPLPEGQNWARFRVTPINQIEVMTTPTTEKIVDERLPDPPDPELRREWVRAAAAMIESLRAELAESVKLLKSLVDASTKLRAKNAEQAKEIEILRLYGNKDCTNQADEALEVLRRKP